MTLFVSGGAAAASAQEPTAQAEPKPDTTTQAEAEERPRFAAQVVITATRAERPVDETPLSATVLDARDVAQAPVLATDDLLRTVQGINLPLLNSNQLFPSENLLSIRGIGGGRALVMLDGVALNDAFFGNIQWNRVPTQGVERVEITRGSGSSLFGNYSLGGTVGLWTKPAAERALSLDSLLGSYGTRRFDAFLGSPIGQRTGVALSANYFETDGAVLVPPEDRDTLDGPESARALNAQLRLDAQWSRSAAWLRASYFDDDLSSGTPLSSSSQRIYDVAARGFIGVGRGRVSASASYQSQRLGIDNAVRLAPGTEFLANHHELPIQDLGFSLEWSGGSAAGRPWLSAGADFREVAGDDEIRNFTPTGSPSLVQTVGGQQRFIGLFGQTGFSVGRLELLLSARADHWRNFDGYDNRRPGSDVAFEDKVTTQLNPRLAVRYELSRHAHLRGAVYRAFRAPTLNELYRPIVAKTFEVVPNPQLGPEKLLGGDVGMDLRLGRLRGQLNGFLSHIEDLVSRSVVGFSPRLRFVLANLGLNRSAGLEAFGSLDLALSWSLEAGYAFTDSIIAENPENPSIEGNLVPGISRHVATLSLRYARPSGLFARIRGRYLSEQFGDTANQLELDPHTVIDFSASLPLNPRFSVYLIGENVLGESYIAENRGTRRLGPPRQVSAGIRLRLAPKPGMPATAERAQ